MKLFFIKLWHQWKELLSDSKFKWSLFAGISLLCIAFYINFRAARYTDSIPVISVGDLILDFTRKLDLSHLFALLSGMFTFGIYFVAFFVTFYPIFFKPERVPFTAKTVAAFILIRAFFISLTHIGAPVDYFRLPQLEDQPGVFKFFYMNDLFFSGHTGFPFLVALLFWDKLIIRWFFIIMSILQGFTVLLMRVHYSIDVFSAYFITYSIYVVSDKIFNNLNLSFKKIVIQIEERMRLR